MVALARMLLSVRHAIAERNGWAEGASMVVGFEEDSIWSLERVWLCVVAFVLFV